MISPIYFFEPSDLLKIIEEIRKSPPSDESIEVYHISTERGAKDYEAWRSRQAKKRQVRDDAKAS